MYKHRVEIKDGEALIVGHLYIPDEESDRPCVVISHEFGFDQNWESKYALELSRLYATDEAIGDGINFYDLEDFSIVICKPGKRVIYSQCRWSGIEESAKLHETVVETLTLISRHRMEIKA